MIVDITKDAHTTPRSKALLVKLIVPYTSLVLPNILGKFNQVTDPHKQQANGSVPYIILYILRYQMRRESVLK